MIRILPTALATALMSVSALAFAQSQPAAPPESGMAAPAPATPPAGQMSPPPPAAPEPAAPPAPPPPAADSAPAAAPPSDSAPPPVPPKPKMHHHHAKAHKGAVREVEETEVLNKLEAAGYSMIKDIHAENGSYKATATKDGKEQPVEVSKTGEITSGSGDAVAPATPPAPPAPPPGEAGSPPPPAAGDAPPPPPPQ